MAAVVQLYVGGLGTVLPVWLITFFISVFSPADDDNQQSLVDVERTRNTYTSYLAVSESPTTRTFVQGVDDTPLHY